MGMQKIKLTIFNIYDIIIEKNNVIFNQIT